MYVSFFTTHRTLTFLYLPARSFWLLLCPSVLAYDWQMASIPVIKTVADPRVAMAAAFYLLLAALAMKAVLSGKGAAKVREIILAAVAPGRPFLLSLNGN